MNIKYLYDYIVNPLYFRYKLLFNMAYHVQCTYYPNNRTNTYFLHLLYLDINIFVLHQVVITAIQ